MDANAYLVLTNSASKRTLFPSNDKENESDDSIGHMSPLSSSPDRYSSPVISPKCSPLRNTPSPLSPSNHQKAQRLSRHDTWQLKSFGTPLKSNQLYGFQRSPKVAATPSQISGRAEENLICDLVDETPEKNYETRMLMSPFSCLGSKTSKKILETPDTSSVRKAIFTDFHKRNESYEMKPESWKTKPASNLGSKLVAEIPKRTFYKSFPKARTSLFSEKMPPKIPITTRPTRKRSRSPSEKSLKTNRNRAGHSRFGKRKKAGEINSGVFHRIKRPKLKPVEPIKLPKLMPQDRIDEYLSKNVNVTTIDNHMEVEQSNKSNTVVETVTTPKKSQPVEKPVGSPPADPSKKFFKTNRTLAINREATVSVVDSMKIQVRNGKFKLKNHELKQKLHVRPVLQDKTNISKKTENVFEDIVTEPVPEKVKESVQCILESLVEGEEEIPNKLMPDASQDVQNEVTHTLEQICSNELQGSGKQSIPSELPTSPNQSILSITASTSSLVLNDAVKITCPEQSSMPVGEEEDRRLYPIFYKNGNQDFKSNGTPSPVRKKTPKTVKKWKYIGNDQYQIDAGQKRFGLIQCKDCGIVYNTGDAEDELSHYNLHNNIQSLKFTGWTEENIVHTYPNGRVIVIQPNDSKRKLNKMRQVLDVVDRELGVVDPEMKHLDISKVYLFINGKSVVGCIVVHPRTEAYKMLSVGTDDIDCCSAESYPVKCGVSRLWTAKDYRKQGVATRLMDCVRLSFMYGHILEREEIAFSVPTREGKAFAEKYTGTSNFLVYN